MGALAPGRQREPAVELQGAGWDEPGVQKKPAGHAVTFAPTQNWPAGHAIEADEPSTQIWPSGHETGAVMPGAQVARAGHSICVDALGQ